MKKKPLEIKLELVNIRDIEESPINPQEMTEGDFNRLVKNLKEDGVLTSTILLMQQPVKNKFMCISGHHRVKAAIKAGIEQVPSIIIPEIEESKRIRLQLVHNDIHGNPNKEILLVLQNLLNDIDISLVNTIEINNSVEDAKKVQYEVPVFTYVNICLLEESRESLVNTIMAMENNKSENWLIEKEEYKHMKDLLTLAFKNGFKTPGQAFRKFLDIVEENKDLILR